eukprot:3345004-Prymnesium_polylepis.2
MPTVLPVSPLRERNSGADNACAMLSSPRSALKSGTTLSGTPKSRDVCRRVSFGNLEDLLQLPERREKFSYPTPPGNRAIKRSPGTFEVFSTTESPTGEAVAFGLFHPLRESVVSADAAPAPFVSPMPPDGRQGEHIRFADDGTAQLVRAGSWVASTLCKNIGQEEPPTLTLWHECDEPSEGVSAMWSAAEWNAWDRGQWGAWEDAQSEEWACDEWAAEWAAGEEEVAAWGDAMDTASPCASPGAPPSVTAISTPDSAKEVYIFGECGRLQRARGATPDEYKPEGRHRQDWQAMLYGIRLATTESKAPTPSGSARARKFNKIGAAAAEQQTR